MYFGEYVHDSNSIDTHIWVNVLSFLLGLVFYYKHFFFPQILSEAGFEDQKISSLAIVLSVLVNLFAVCSRICILLYLKEKLPCDEMRWTWFRRLYCRWNVFFSSYEPLLSLCFYTSTSWKLLINIFLDNCLIFLVLTDECACTCKVSEIAPLYQICSSTPIHTFICRQGGQPKRRE